MIDWKGEKVMKQYIQPQISVCRLAVMNVLMASGEGGGRNVSTNINVHGGNNSGDVAGAF